MTKRGDSTWFSEYSTEVTGRMGKRNYQSPFVATQRVWETLLLKRKLLAEARKKTHNVAGRPIRQV
jgi:hypothetical protein